MLIGYICGTTVSRSKNTAPNEYEHLWEEIEEKRLSTVKEKYDVAVSPGEVKLNTGLSADLVQRYEQYTGASRPA